MRIRKIGVVGAGTMGSGIAALAASAGVPVVLLDVPGGEGDRNGPARKGLERALKAKPAAFMDPDRARLVETGNTEDDLEKLAGCDWIVEAIVEQPGPKQALYARLEELLPPHAVVATNTSGIPMRTLVEGRGEGFRRRFLGTHFFNPVRYLHLLEVIRTPDTDPATIRAIREFGERVLGKGTVLAKDVPGFIANRLGVYGSVQTMRLMEEHDLTIDEVDTLNGPLVGRPKSATFRTADLSGLDILKHVREGLSQATGEDFAMPEWVSDLVAQGRLGEKTGAGFYTKEGKQIRTLDWKTGEYRPQEKPEIPGVAELQGKPLAERVRGVLELPGKYGAFARALYARTWHYTLEKAPELAYDVVAVDRALEWGFAFERGPFRQMDAVGLDRVRELIAAEGLPEPELLRRAGPAFYREDGHVAFDGSVVPTPEAPGRISLAALGRDGRVLEEGAEAALLDLGDGVALLEFRSKLGTLGEGVLRMLHTALERVAGEDRAGLVIGHEDARAFSAGANLVATLGAAKEGRWEELDRSVRAFQDTILSIRRASFPVVVAPFGLALGGGAEMTLHADRVQAHAELYTGLVETGVGLLPAGGGTKELLFRFTADLQPYEDADPFEAVRRAFGLIALAKTSASALEARRMGFLRECDRISMGRHHLLADAKARVLDLAPGYTAPLPRTVTALGKKALGNLRYGIWALREAGQITDHEVQIANEVAYVLCGGDGSPREVTEQDVLDLEREGFLRLLGTEKTQERIAHTLKTGKPLRN
ncbi:MAG TPA: 3-hydroxyacyl-CoA dehydrogenase/enoyl-CoA hydratase family protein [Longimicrobiaceae bacterium]|nr:3-hydroxyacyl-CoA dehydrogenase/enoyl-CoA hydratase family protein [Longimicrobiaceae bacterium]